MSIQLRARLGSMLFTMSMRMCSLESSVHAAHSRNTAPNRIHWISSHELEEVLKTLRTVALAALMRMAARMAQATTWPMRALKASTARLNRSNVFNRSSLAEAGRRCAIRPSQRSQCIELYARVI